MYPPRRVRRVSALSRRRRCVGRGAPGGRPRVRRGARRRRRARSSARPEPRPTSWRSPSPATAARWSAWRECPSPSWRCGWRCRCWPNGSSRPAARSAPKRSPLAPPSTRTPPASCRTSGRWPICPGSRAPPRARIGELQLAGVDAAAVRDVSHVGHDLAALLGRAATEAAAAGAVSRAEMLAAAAARLRTDPAALPARAVLLLDVAITRLPNGACSRRWRASRRRCWRPCPAATSPRARRCGGVGRRRRVIAGRRRDRGHGAGPTAPVALRRRHAAAKAGSTTPCMCSRRPAKVAKRSRSSAACAGSGAGRAVRRDGRAAARAAHVPRAARARLLARRDPGVVRARHAPARCGRPCAAGAARVRGRRALGAPLRRVPLARPGAGRAISAPPEQWSPPTADLDRRRSCCRVRPRRGSDAAPLDEAPPPGERDGERVVAGTLQAPWRWEELLVEAYVIKGLDRWQRRLPGLRARVRRRLRELAEEDPDSPRIAALRRDCQQLTHLEDVRAPDRRDARRVARQRAVGGVARSLRGPGAARAPATGARAARARRAGAARQRRSGRAQGSARRACSRRLRTLTHEPPRRRHGRVFVGTRHAGARPVVPRRVRARPRGTGLPAAPARRCAAARHPPRRACRGPGDAANASR